MSETITRRLPHPYHHGDLREALIEAAVQAAEHGGHESVNFTSLARGLGVSQAAPYRHFADRNALLVEVGERGFRAFSSAVRLALATEDGRTRLGRMAHAYVDFGLGRPGLYHVMYSSGIMPAADLGSPLQLAARECFDIMLDTLHPGLGEDARRRFGLKIWASVHGIVTMVEQGLLPPPASDVITIGGLVDELVADLELAMGAAAANSADPAREPAAR